MKSEEIEKLIEYYEDRIINNFDNHFSHLVLEDFYEGGYKDRTEDEFFYEEYFSKYENGIINLLLEIENKMDSEFIVFKLRLIKLKRIIDSHLSKISNDVETKNLRSSRKSNFLLNQSLDAKKFIEFLHNQLFNNHLIKTDLENFKNHFSQDKWDDKTQWLGTELQITNLITLLIENEYLDSETSRFKYKLIALHFVNKKGSEFNEKQLSSVFADKKDMMFNDITNSIMDEISTHF